MIKLLDPPGPDPVGISDITDMYMEFYFKEF